MKTYLEIADDVFQKGEACLKRKKEKEKKIKETAAFAALTAVILFSAFGITKGILPQKAPVILPGSSNALETATTAQSGETFSTTADISTQNAAPGAQTTSPRESGTTATRAAGGADVSQKPPASVSGSDEPMTTGPDGSGQTEPMNEPEPAIGLGGDEEATTDSSEPSTQAPDEPDEEQVTETTRRPISDKEQTTRRRASAAASYNAEGMLRAAVEENAYGWIKYNGHYYVYDKWTNADSFEPGEQIGEAGALEGNLELLGFSGDVYLTENGEEDGCLLLKTSDGQKMVFILNPAGDNN